MGPFLVYFLRGPQATGPEGLPTDAPNSGKSSVLAVSGALPLPPTADQGASRTTKPRGSPFLQDHLNL